MFVYENDVDILSPFSNYSHNVIIFIHPNSSKDFIKSIRYLFRKSEVPYDSFWPLFINEIPNLKWNG